MEHGLESVVRRFRIPGAFASAEAWGSGHINDTFAVTVRDGGAAVRYLLQRVNHEVFADPPAVTANIRRVTDHLRAKLAAAGRADLRRRVLTLVPVRDGTDCLQDEAGNHWRAYLFIEGTKTRDVVKSPRTAREAALAFGRFQRDLADLPGPRLAETIPAFHDTPARFEAFRAALEEDAAGRAREVRPEIDFALAREGMTRILLDAREAGEIPERIAHNDAKVDNVLFDEATGEGLCVIDLDTVMPGLSLCDFGDLVRTGASTAAEDERDPGRVCVRPDLFAALVGGYLEAAGDMLAAAERDLLLLSGRIITFETGLRFLTDHLRGDVYFKTRRSGHNLDRCRTQFALVRSLEARDDELSRIAREAG